MTIDTKEAIIDWLKQQGVSTVLLCAILAFLGYQSVHLDPVRQETIKNGYKEFAEIQSKAIESMVKSHDSDRQMFIDLLNGRQIAGKP